ncbi:MAG TPA: hypothetical protein VH682_22945 [Gemmataceae bacterium]|jgi:hypothetical protein
MTDRERQRQLDRLAIQFVDALEAGDFATVDKLWSACATDPELETVFLDTAAELARTLEEETRTQLEATVMEAVEQHLPSAELIRTPAGPLTVAEVAEFIRSHPPAGWATDEIVANEQLRESAELVPTELGMSQVLDWGRQFGSLPETYWRAFRQAALKLRMRRESDVHYQMAARQTKRKRPEANS